jgi:membrane protein implicated in regulation of membrane protease activity
MKKIIWLCFLIALIVVNALAMLADYAWGVYIAIPYRLVVVLALSFVSLVFIGAWRLVQGAEKDRND